jgi:hypothetical protein
MIGAVHLPMGMVLDEVSTENGIVLRLWWRAMPHHCSLNFIGELSWLHFRGQQMGEQAIIQRL